MTEKVLFQKVNQILNLVRTLLSRSADSELPNVDFIVDNFDRQGGMGKYWNHSGAFAPNGSGADIVGGANQLTDFGTFATQYGSGSVRNIIEPLQGIPALWTGGGGASMHSAGVATYQARLRGSYTAEVNFLVPSNTGTRAIAVCLYLSASGIVNGGMMSALGSRVGFGASLDTVGNAGAAVEPFIADKYAWANSPTDAASGDQSLTAAGGAGQVHIATTMPSSKIISSARLISFKAYVNDVTAPSETGHGIIEDGTTTWFDAYHDSDGNYNPLAFD